MKRIIALIGLVALCGCTTFENGHGLELKSLLNTKSISGMEITIATNGSMHVVIDKYDSNQTDAMLAAIALISELTAKAEAASVAVAPVP